MRLSVRAVLCRQFGSTEHLAISPIEIGPPGAGEVRVRVAAVGINFPDALTVRGTYQERPDLPFVPGGELAGTVVARGEGVDEFDLGDAVMAVTFRGALAEEVNVAAGTVRRVPSGMSPIAAAAFQGVYFTAYYALVQRGQLQPGETLLVLGSSGGVGLAAVQIGCALGARVIAAASTADKVAFAMQMGGATAGIAYRSESLRARLREIEPDGAIDVVLDPVGGSLLEEAARSLRWNGRYVVVGFASGTIASLPTNLPLLKGFALLGAYYGRFRDREPAVAETVADAVERLYAQGKIRPIIHRTFPMEHSGQALTYVEAGHALGKVVVQIDA